MPPVTRPSGRGRGFSYARARVYRRVREGESVAPGGRRTQGVNYGLPAREPVYPGECLQRPHSALGYRPPAPEVTLPNDMNETMEIGQMAA